MIKSIFSRGTLIGCLIIFLIVLVVLLIINLLIWQAKRRARKKELRQLADDRQREEVLNSVIVNKHGWDNPVASEFTPYDVDYSQSAKAPISNMQGQGQGRRMVKLTEHNKLSQRSYMMSLDKIIRIGSSMEGNSIVTADINPHQCEIYAYQDTVCIRSLGNGRPTILERKRKKFQVGEEGVAVQTGDKIVVEDIFFEVTIM